MENKIILREFPMLLLHFTTVAPIQMIIWLKIVYRIALLYEYWKLLDTHSKIRLHHIILVIFQKFQGNYFPENLHDQGYTAQKIKFSIKDFFL